MRNSLDGSELLKEMEELADELDSLQFDLEEMKEELQDLLEEFDELEDEGEVEDMKVVHASILEKEKDIVDAEDELEVWKAEYAERLQALQELSEEVNLSDAFLIHEDDFTDYTEDLCKDCGYISDDFPSWIEIDWDATADNVRMDYTSVDFDGESYLVRE
jgi:rubrerythrin